MTEDRGLPGGPSLLGRAAAVAVVVLALAVAAAAAGAPDSRAGEATVDVPWGALVLGVDAVTGAFVVVGLLLVVAVAWVVVTSDGRHDRERRPWWHVPVVLGILGGVTLVAALLLQGLGGGADRLAGVQRLLEELWGAAGPETGGAPAGAAIDPATRIRAAVAGAVAVLVAVAGWAWWRLRGSGAAGEDVGEQPLADVIDAARDDLDTGGDARRAILRCYARLDAALATAGCARRPAETAREHRHRAAGTLGAAGGAAAALVDRFERARYHDGPVGEADRRAALAALLEVQATLRHEAAP